MRKPDKTLTPKLFRGEAKFMWEERLLQAGWPQPLAGRTAAFITGDGPMPVWPPRFGDYVTGGGGDGGGGAPGAKGGGGG